TCDHCITHPAFIFFLFFFQAEDGIRDRNVTGVKTCALPIWGEAPLRLPDIDAHTQNGVLQPAGLKIHGGLGEDAADLPAPQVHEIGRASCRDTAGTAEGEEAVKEKRTRNSGCSVRAQSTVDK